MRLSRARHRGSSPGERVRQVTSANTPAQVAAFAADLSYDVIQFAGGMYTNFRACDLPNRAGHPLTLRPNAGQTVTFDCAGDGNYGDGIFRMLTTNADILFDGSYGGGRFVFQHILLAQTGVFLALDTLRLAIRGCTFTRIAANANSNSSSSHLFYFSHGCGNISISDIIATHLLTADEPLATAGCNGVQLYTGGTLPAIHDVAISNVSISNVNWGIVVRNATTGLIVDGLHVTDGGHEASPAAADFGADNTGIVRNSSTVASVGTPHIQGIMADGGGNTWA